MTDERVAAIEALLERAKAAHGEYEANELKGVYDEDWARWYAGYAVAHGIDSLLSREVTVDELAAHLAGAWAEAEAADPKPTEPWAAYTARRLADAF